MNVESYKWQQNKVGLNMFKSLFDPVFVLFDTWHCSKGFVFNGKSSQSFVSICIYVFTTQDHGEQK